MAEWIGNLAIILKTEKYFFFVNEKFISRY